MTKLTTSLAMIAALLTGGLIAVPARAESKPPAKQPGVLRVFDEAKMFSSSGTKTAESHMAGASFDHGLTLTVDTHPGASSGAKAGV